MGVWLPVKGDTLVSIIEMPLVTGAGLDTPMLKDSIEEARDRTSIVGGHQGSKTPRGTWQSISVQPNVVPDWVTYPSPCDPFEPGEL